MVRTIGRCAAWFCVLIALFCLLMTAAYSVLDERIEWHREYSLVVLEIEESWESLGNIFGFHGQPGMLDNTTDRVMLESTKSMEGGSAFEAGLHVNGYTRYWHGYQAILRPMLTRYQIHQIRYIQLFVFFGLLLAMLCALKRRMGNLPALAFFVTTVCSGIITIPSSMQFMASFAVMMIASLFVLCRYPFRKRGSLPLFFMVTGMVISFLDLLTVPLVTLGVPLLLCLGLEKQDGRPLGIRGAVMCCLAWGLGYALCWASKWVLSAVVLGNDVFEQAAEHAAFWTMGSAQASVPVDRAHAIRLNFSDFFMLQGMRTMVIPLLPLAGLALCAVCRPVKRYWRRAALMAAVSLFPYAWYAVLAAHSLEHHWFTYRAQFITLFGLYMAVIGLIDLERLRAAQQSAIDLVRARFGRDDCKH